MTESLLQNNIVIFLILLAAVFGLVGLFIALSAWVGPRKPSSAKNAPFESGWIVKTDAAHAFPIKYYLVAILFIVFDIEVAFLYPWAVSFIEIGLAGFISMIVFLAVLLVGLYYAVSKRVLEWK